MDTRDLFIAVLVALYVSDLWWWVPRRALIFRGVGSRLRWTSASRSGFATGSRLALVRFGALPFGHAYATDFPIMFREGNKRRRVTWPPFAPDAYAAASEIVEGGLAVDGMRVRSASGEVARYSSAAAAQRALEQLDDVVVGTPQAIRERVDAFRADSVWLRGACTLSFLFAFGVVPLALHDVVPLEWPALLAGHFALVLVIQGLFWRLHRRIYPEGRAERWTKVAAMFISPPEAMVAGYSLGRGLLAGQHPLAVAKAVCSPEDFRRLAELSVRGTLIAEPMVQERLTKVLHTLGVDVAALLSTPDREPACASYCPRCLAQFTDAPTACPDCLAVAAVRF